MKMKTTYLLFTLISMLVFSCKKEVPIEPGTGTLPLIIDSDITETTTLTNRVADSTIADYCITDFINIRNGAGLIIEPGVTIEFTSDAGISVGTYTEAGYIVADGYFSSEITFTGKTKSPGFWRGIAISPTNTDSRNLINNCIIEYAGSSILGTTSAGFGYQSAIGVGASSDGNVGLLSIKNSTIRNNNGKGYSCKTNSGLNEFFNNEFIDNSEEAIFMGAIGFSKIDILTTFSGNGFDGIYQDDFAGSIETILDESTHTWANANGPYFLSRGIRLNNASASLNLGFGVELIMGAGTMINSKAGTFSAIGQLAENRIIIRGQTSGVSSWKGILIEANTDNLIKNCDISEGGNEIFLPAGCNGSANIGVFYWAGTLGKVTVENCSLNYSGGCGIYNETFSLTQHGDLIQTGNTFSGNASSNVCE